MNKKILIVDDEEGMCSFIKQALSQIGLEADYILKGREALEKYKNYDMAILDIRMPEISGIEILDSIKQKDSKFPVIIMSAFGDYKQASELLAKGADDYLQKPFNLEDMIFRVQKTLEVYRLKQEVNVYKSERLSRLPKIIYKSDRMKNVLNLVDKVAGQNIPVLITGESGTGKELVARAIHYNKNNPRRERFFSIVDCSALSETLLDDELFGHVKGAFTGAINNKDGLFEDADGGTLFLDEVADATLSTQSKLLRVVETGEFRKLGETRLRNADVRIIVATNKPLRELVKRETFREDLYQRLKGIEIHIPPLRERKEDIVELANFFVRMFNKEFGKDIEFQKESIEKLTECEWKGNVRELKSMIQKIVLLAERKVVTVKCVENVLHIEPSRGIKGKTAYAAEDLMVKIGNKSFSETKAKTINDFERKFLSSLMKECEGNLSRASKRAKIDRKYLRDKLRKHKIR